MKKLLNSPDRYVDDMLDGLAAAHPSLKRTGPEGRVIVRSEPPGKAKVGIASGGGSGHLPLFTGYVGAGLLDSCAIGDVFAGPNLDSCVAAIQAADMGRGVLRLYGNYGGDRMNFDLAGDMLGWDASRLTTVLGNDDVASAPAAERAKRRGVAGLIYAYKTAGASADAGADLQEVTRVARKTVDATRTIGCALSPCQVPGAQAPTFELGDGEMEMGMGIHGEPGIWRDRLKPADAVADELVARVLAETPDTATGRVAVLLNTLGATPLEELYILYRRIASGIASQGLDLRHRLVGHYATSMEMAGVSLSVLHLDDELEALLNAPADCPFWRVGR
ncbi:dihydroxyacetone kinase subunit DhaK [Bordetella genomosp. 9]|uniref:Dihydroxyacetone kinase n=1 Tax=Bordetella genomosp. 9 TaxID=1416803 RepID=A0A1W6Z076_9BORD|nr:dihydroxyacetone kinase subunit DhaK [Bordetella genomosp. 9]ARP86708.1 dihydroxyacetone kinase [Bordetella genomosp. 9]